MSTVILHISDSHGGLMSGLLAPGTKLEYDNGEIVETIPSSTSLWIWDCYHKLIDTANDFAGSDPVVVYHTGDVCHGCTYPDYLYSVHQDHQEQIAVQALHALTGIRNLAAFRLCYGTGVHDYGQSAATKSVASSAAAWGVPVACVDHGIETVDGCEVDWAHPGPRHGYGMDKSGPVRLYAIRCARPRLERGQRAPDIILRGHVHTPYLDYVNVPWGMFGVRMLVSIAPPLTGPNEWARRYNHTESLTVVGGTLIRVENGRVLDFHGVWYEREERQRVEGLVAHPYQGSVSKN